MQITYLLLRVDLLTASWRLVKDQVANPPAANVKTVMINNSNFCPTDLSFFATIKQEHSKNADLCQGNSSLDPQSGSAYQDDYQNLIGDSLSKDMSMINFFRRSGHFFQSFEPNCGKMPNLAMVKNPSKNSQIGNLTSSFLSTETSPVKFPWRSIQ